MLTTIINLNKIVLVVDAPIGELTAIGNDNEVYYAIKGEGENYTKIVDGKKWKFLCKGEELTEEIAESLIPIKDKDSAKKYPKAFLVSYKRFTNAFIDVLENQGFYWLENPYQKELDNCSAYTDMFTMAKRARQHSEAESKTFKHPLIFEIL